MWMRRLERMIRRIRIKTENVYRVSSRVRQEPAADRVKAFKVIIDGSGTSLAPAKKPGGGTEQLFHQDR